jgi:uncharacterized protein YhbP (UPF0306 family)
MEQPEKRIIDFIKKHHVLTLATSKNNKSWCSNCFYAYDPEKQILIFTSSDETRHIEEIKTNPVVAASIVLETKIIGKILGLQIEGTITKQTERNDLHIKTLYLKKFPFAILTNTPLWVLQINFLKFTDNRLGFGKKLIWENPANKDKK